MVTYPDDKQYRSTHALELTYIDPLAGSLTFFNDVQAPQHGASSFDALKTAIGSADDIYIATWLMDPNLELLRDGWDQPVQSPARQDVRLGNVLLAAATRGARVSIILWNYLQILTDSDIPKYFGTTPDLDQLNFVLPGDLLLETGDMGKSTVDIATDWTQKFRPIYDLRTRLRKVSADNNIIVLPHPTSIAGSLHQKFWVLRTGKRLVGFVGGINMSQWDWDDPTHDPLNPRRNPPDMAGSDRKARLDQGQPPVFDPRHDWMMRVDGHAAYALREEFYDRWVASRQPAPPKTLTDPTDVEHTGGMFVQVSRQWPLDAAPGQILRAYVQAISKATKYIYIENQYWTSSVLTDAIIDRLNSGVETVGLQIIIVLPSKAEDAGASWSILPEQLFQLNRIRSSCGPGKCLVYQPFRKVPNSTAYVGVYVHAKLAIVDDRWLTVGSANTNNRSMGLDAECNAQLAHADVVTGIRKSIWTELLGDNVGADDSPSLAIEQGFRKIGVQNGQAMRSGDPLHGLVVPFNWDPSPSRPRPPERLRKYI